jgi:hypothetical protein
MYISLTGSTLIAPPETSGTIILHYNPYSCAPVPVPYAVTTETANPPGAPIASTTVSGNQPCLEAALKLGYVISEEFDRIVDPKKMVGNPRKDLEV